MWDLTTNGIKVEEIASWVGLGWSLNAGGVITRQVRGIPDDYNAYPGFINPNNIMKVETFLSLLEPERRTQAIEAINGRLDLEADMYSFNVNGYSGQFFFDQDGNVHLSPAQPIRITPIFLDPNYKKWITSWSLTTPDGTQYQFAARGIQKNLTDDIPINEVVNAWHLTKVVSATGREINLRYRLNQQYMCIMGSEVRNWLRIGDPQCNYSSLVPPSATNFLNNEPELEEITFLNHSVRFTSTPGREDLQDGRRLTQIDIYENGGLLKRFTLTQDYMNSPEGIANACGAPFYNKRLRLLSVTESGRDGATKPPYRFEYNPVELPHLHSKAQDHWGYYNEANGNSTLIPSVISSIALPIWFSGGNREAKPQATQAGVLTKITYPTGGYTVFDYENNTVPASSYLDFIAEYANLRYEDSYDDLNAGMISGVQEYPFSIPIYNARPIKWQISGLVDCNLREDACDVDFRIVNAQTGGIVEIIRDLERENSLSPGNYKLIVNVRILNNKNRNARIKLEYPSSALGQAPNQSYVAGGLRIAKIQDHDGQGFVNEKRFNYNNAAGRSNGVFTSLPVYGSVYSLIFRQANPVDPGNPFYCDLSLYQRTSFSQTPLATSHGSHVNYTQVEVMETNRGKIVYDYQFTPDETNPRYPFPPSNSLEWARGQLLRQTDYSLKLDGTYSKVREVENRYNGLGASIYKRVESVKVVGQGTPLGAINYERYYTSRDALALSKTITRNYSQTDNRVAGD
jgi:hypothetical protein